ncbi:MAG: YwbE family protein [Melioribacteraceae bacterium]|nr:YwbE family protein [Melioribacteraceae bacterium]MCF8355231.1 YwbE family protein [Melioribacteraceae bacterium]MCF8395218.1 YwbE family protein [Melioribacteraceae bacterium]MCF8420692.1 YwbE family protein [Melioribacteraceae bacterium]
MNVPNRSDIKPGMFAAIVLKEDQRSNKLTEGVIKEILTKSPSHPHGIKVRLETGEIGRVKKLLD